jgi:hypothetical protein
MFDNIYAANWERGLSRSTLSFADAYYWHIDISTLYVGLLGMARYAQKMLQSLFYFAV